MAFTSTRTFWRWAMTSLSYPAKRSSRCCRSRRAQGRGSGVAPVDGGAHGDIAALAVWGEIAGCPIRAVLQGLGAEGLGCLRYSDRKAADRRRVPLAAPLTASRKVRDQQQPRPSRDQHRAVG